MARILVLDGHSAAALAFTRSLGRARHWVAVGSHRNAFAPAALSRYCRSRFEYPPATESLQRFVDAVLDFATHQQIDLIFPITEWTTYPLSCRREDFPKSCRLAVPPHSALELTMDKYRTIELGRSLGVPVPRTWLVQSEAELNQIPDLKYPIVIKDRSSTRWMGDRAALGSVRYAYASTDLERYVRERLNQVSDALIQEFVGGSGIGFSCFVTGEEIRLPFQWKRLREVDPRGSGSSLRKSVRLDPDILELSRTLILHTGFQGIAMVEYKRALSGAAVLMEINGRPWGSIQLAISAGVDYPRCLADWLLDGSLPEKEIEYRTGIHCRRMVGDLSHLENLRHGKPSQWPLPYPNFWWSLVKIAVPWYPRLRYDDLSFSDPRPGWAGIVEWFGSRLARIHHAKAVP